MEDYELLLDFSGGALFQTVQLQTRFWMNVRRQDNDRTTCIMALFDVRPHLELKFSRDPLLRL